MKIIELPKDQLFLFLFCSLPSQFFLKKSREPKDQIGVASFIFFKYLPFSEVFLQQVVQHPHTYFDTHITHAHL